MIVSYARRRNEAQPVPAVPFSYRLPFGLIIKLVIKFKLHSAVHNGRISYKIL